jgi:hypothetical protein
MAQNATPASVRVGVVLSLSTLSGKKSRTSLSVAIKDFYAANPNYSTRISFNFIDSMNDSVGAASAGNNPNFSFNLFYPFVFLIFTSALFYFDFIFGYFCKFLVKPF